MCYYRVESEGWCCADNFAAQYVLSAAATSAFNPVVTHSSKHSQPNPCCKHPPELLVAMLPRGFGNILSIGCRTAGSGTCCIRLLLLLLLLLPAAPLIILYLQPELLARILLIM
jgi:hypothetical protein